MPTAPSLAAYEPYTRVQVDAANKAVHDCEERQEIALDAYLDAVDATIAAHARRAIAMSAWLDSVSSFKAAKAPPVGGAAA